MVELCLLYLLGHLSGLFCTYETSALYRVFTGLYARLHKELCWKVQELMCCGKCYSSPLDPLLHDRFITPCLRLKGDLHSSIPLLFLFRIYLKPSATNN